MNKANEILKKALHIDVWRQLQTVRRINKKNSVSLLTTAD